MNFKLEGTGVGVSTPARYFVFLFFFKVENPCNSRGGFTA